MRFYFFNEIHGFYFVFLIFHKRRGGDTPLASIRPMSVQNSRTVAVLPTSQTANVASIHGSSSSSSGTVCIYDKQLILFEFFFSFKSQNSIETIKIKINLNFHLFNSNFQSATLALVPPQQQVHTTGAMAGEVMSTTSSGISKKKKKQNKF